MAVFVCLATSAVYLEVVTYMTDDFIAVYKWFTGRKGICTTLRSDCGTNFVGADATSGRQFESSSNELRDLTSLHFSLTTALSGSLILHQSLTSEENGRQP